MTPSFLVFLLLFLALPIAMSVLLLRRLKPLVGLLRQLSDRAAIGALLSPATREALARAGHDPDALNTRSDLSPELRRMLSADVSRAFRGVLIRGVGPEAAQRQAYSAPTMAPPGPQTGPSPAPPPPYASPESGAWLRWAAAAAVIAAAALYLVLAG